MRVLFIFLLAVFGLGACSSPSVLPGTDPFAPSAYEQVEEKVMAGPLPFSESGVLTPAGCELLFKKEAVQCFATWERLRPEGKLDWVLTNIPPDERVAMLISKKEAQSVGMARSGRQELPSDFSLAECLAAKSLPEDLCVLASTDIASDAEILSFLSRANSGEEQRGMTRQFEQHQFRVPFDSFRRHRIEVPRPTIPEHLRRK